MKRWQKFVLAILYITGGAVGIFAAIIAFISGQAGESTWLVALFVCIFGWAIWLGVRVIRTQGTVGSGDLWFWALQIPILFTPPLTWFLVNGFGFALVWEVSAGGIAFSPYLGAQFGFRWNRPGPLSLGINLVALVIFIWLYCRRRKQRARNAFVPLSDSGTTGVPSV